MLKIVLMERLIVFGALSKSVSTSSKATKAVFKAQQTPAPSGRGSGQPTQRNRARSKRPHGKRNNLYDLQGSVKENKDTRLKSHRKLQNPLPQNSSENPPENFASRPEPGHSVRAATKASFQRGIIVPLMK